VSDIIRIRAYIPPTPFPTRRAFHWLDTQKSKNSACAMASLMRLRLFTGPSRAQYQFRAVHSNPFSHRALAFSVSLSHNSRPSFPHRFQLVFIPSRSISLGSIFSSKPSPIPSPQAVAHVAKIEATANSHPYDVEKQLALFQALSDTNIQPAYELIVSRWERMTEFVRPFCLTPLSVRCSLTPAMPLNV
jgi:hypothetical protein